MKSRQKFALLMNRKIPVPLLFPIQLLALNESMILGGRAVTFYHDVKHSGSPEKHNISPVTAAAEPPLLMASFGIALA